VTVIFHGDDYQRAGWFLDVFFTRAVLSLVEIGNLFERRSAGGSGRNWNIIIYMKSFARPYA